MIARIFSRAARQLRHQTWALYLLAFIIVAAVAVPAFSHWRRGEMIFPPTILAATPARQPDCADTFMAAMVGPNEAAARAAYRCTAGSVQRQLVSEAQAVASNAQFETEPPPVRVGQSVTFTDGAYYVYFYGISPDGTQHAWMILTIQGGKVVKAE